MTRAHQEEIIDQFTRQAIPFTEIPGHLDAIGILIEMSHVDGDDTVLDVACGPGMVACEFARRAKFVTGIDITPAMIGEAEKRQREQGTTNMAWKVGDVLPLPFPDDSFSVVITRYSFHHFLEPGLALAEMIRVCRPGGRVLVADVSIPPEKGEAYDRLEVMRDPSHVHALTTVEFSRLFRDTKLHGCVQSAYDVEIELEAQLKASFPKPGDMERLREMITGDIGVNSFGINARRSGNSVWYTVPIGVFVGTK